MLKMTNRMIGFYLIYVNGYQCHQRVPEKNTCYTRVTEVYIIA